MWEWDERPGVLLIVDLGLFGNQVRGAERSFMDQRVVRDPRRKSGDRLSANSGALKRVNPNAKRFLRLYVLFG